VGRASAIAWWVVADGAAALPPVVSTVRLFAETGLVFATGMLAFLAVCLFVHLVFAPGTPFTKLLALATQGNELARYVMAASVVVIVGTWFVWVLLMLKMFIWNLYQSVLLSITTEEMPRQEKAKRSD